MAEIIQKLVKLKEHISNIYVECYYQGWNLNRGVAYSAGAAVHSDHVLASERGGVAVISLEMAAECIFITKITASNFSNQKLFFKLQVVILLLKESQAHNKANGGLPHFLPFMGQFMNKVQPVVYIIERRLDHCPYERYRYQVKPNSIIINISLIAIFLATFL